MREARFTELQLREEKFGLYFHQLISIGAVRLLGIFWKKYWRCYQEIDSRDWVFQYE